MADQRDGSNMLFRAYACCEIFLVIIIVVLACTLTAPLSGARYYTLGEDGDGFGPNCRAIINPSTKNGTKILLGKFGGGRIGNFTYASPLKEIERVYGKVHVDIVNAPVMNSDECKVIFAEGLILDGATGQQVPMPDECGGVTPGVWQDGGSDWEGVWVAPLIFGALGWGVVRYALIVMNYLKMKLDDGSAVKYWIGWMFYPVKLAATFLLLPISNMKVTDACPQILTSYYSGPTSVTLNTLLVAFPFLLCCGFMWQACRGGGGGDRLVERAAIAGGIYFIIWLVPVLVFQSILVINASWSFLFGIRFYFELKWPGFSFAVRLCVYGVLMLFLWLLDTLEFAYERANHIRSCLLKKGNR